MTVAQQVERVGLIGDVHAEDGLLECALDYLRSQSVDLVLCTGDVADGLGSVSRCCELLVQRGIQVVRGNHDRWLLANRMRELPDATEANALGAEALAYLAGLPPTLDFTCSIGGLLLCHGLGSNDMASFGAEDFGYALENNLELQTLIRDPRYGLVVNGHTHRPMLRHFPGLTVINAGTLQRGEDPGFLLADFRLRQVEMLRFGTVQKPTLHRSERLQG